MVDMDQQLVRCDRAVCDNARLYQQGIRGRAIADFSHPEDIEENQRLYRSLTASEIDHFQIDKRYLRKDGSIAWGRVTLSKVPQEGSTPSFTVGMIEDITERKKNDGDLQRFRAAMDASGNTILLVDRARMRYVDVNQTLCELVGYSREEILGMTPMDLFSADRETLERDYNAIIADNSSSASKVEGEYRRKDGALIPIETRRRACLTRTAGSSSVPRATSPSASATRRASSSWRPTTGSPGCRTAPAHDRLTQAIGYARRAGADAAVMFIDLDRFKVSTTASATRRRRAAEGSGERLQACAARGRHRRAPGRRRVPGAARRPAPGRRRRHRGAEDPRRASSARSRSTAARCTSARASASASIPRTARRSTRCCATPTSRCTAPRTSAATPSSSSRRR